MRPEPEMAAATPVITHLSPPHPHAPTSCDPHAHGCRWWPYSNSNDFGANTAMILIILLCALICALALNTAIRCFLRGGGSSSVHRTPNRLAQLDENNNNNRKPNIEAGEAPVVVAPTVVYSAEMKLGGGEAECAICLSEFIDGEEIRVLGKCKHGFHVSCVQRWLNSHSSCPTCRRSCLAEDTPATTEIVPDQIITIPV
ncbi:RING-H2 finger protein ATL79-like [Euphorbia lathyris]|uniref:RING-H2 finger protein ATL79-like n=1 Tax=Euphorbia lathyris TaxID=212925 RepID=UPI003313E472